MSKHAFKLHVVDLLPLTLDEVKQKLADSSARLGDIGFMDMFVEHRPEGQQPMSFGVYLFFNPEKVCTYVGQSTQSFATRIGAHLGDRTMKNLYLQRAHTPTEGFEGGHYAPKIDELREHRLTLVNAYNWAGTKEVFTKALSEAATPVAGVDVAKLEQRFPGPWSKDVEQLREKLENVLQAAFCPPEGTTPDPFLIKPKKGRGGLLGLKEKMEKQREANFAQLLLL